MKDLALLLVLVVAASAVAPAQPQWPANFSVSWNEETHYPSGIKWSGGFTYWRQSDSTLVWARWDSWADAYTNTTGINTYDTQAQHIVKNGVTYIYYPILGKCCTAGTAAQNAYFGPGVPNLANATYLGPDVYYGVKVYLWKLPNWIYYESQNPNPVKRNFTALFGTGFGNDTYSYAYSFSRTVKSSVFNLPGSCTSSKLCAGTSAAARSGQTVGVPPTPFN